MVARGFAARWTTMATTCAYLAGRVERRGVVREHLQARRERRGLLEVELERAPPVGERAREELVEREVRVGRGRVRHHDAARDLRDDEVALDRGDARVRERLVERRAAAAAVRPRPLYRHVGRHLRAAVHSVASPGPWTIDGYCEANALCMNSYY